MVTSVVGRSPAAAKGLERGDVVLAVNNVKVRTLDDLAKAVENAYSRSSLVLSVLRDAVRLQPDVRDGVASLPPRSSDTTIPARTRPAPAQSRRDMRSPRKNAAKRAVKTGSSANMIAACVAGMRACAHVCARNVTTVATSAIQRIARTTVAVEDERPRLRGEERARAAHERRQREAHGADADRREEDLSEGVPAHVVRRGGLAHDHDEDRVGDGRHEDEEVARVEAGRRVPRPRQDREAERRDQEPREVLPRGLLPRHEVARDGRERHREARDERGLGGRREELARRPGSRCRPRGGGRRRRCRA